MAVRERSGDIDVLLGHLELETRRGIAHREQKPAALHKIMQAFGDGLLECRNVGVAIALGSTQIAIAFLDKPGRIAESQVQFVELAGEIFVEQMNPVEFRNVGFQDLVVPDLRVLDAGILQRECDGVIPGR